ncbi:MAG TPA: helix-hairpin-helix domain-containing protein [Polyangiaceae bacterium]|jgi:competence protein ComEA
MERLSRVGFLGSAARAVKRIVGSRFAKPAAQAALAVSGLLILAVIGRTAVAGSGTTAVPLIDDPGRAPAATASPAPATTTAPSATPPSAPAPSPTPAPVPPSAHATPEEPVALNVAGEADLRRLPGIGAKRADAILALRAHLGRFRAIEDLLKVRGIGRATLRRLRPLVRLDAPPPDAGQPRPPTAP